MFTVAIIGLGNRGNAYGNFLNKHKEVKITALCEINGDFLQDCAKKWIVDCGKTFTDEREFFAAGRLADVLVIATQDGDHYRHALAALENGYNLLLEKPISPRPQECLEIAKLSKQKGLKVVVCHVMRYTPYYIKIKKLIDSGAIGDIAHINHTENVGYWHFSHSYVRGNWRREEESSPSILAKCCHDLDIIYWWTGKRCLSLSSCGKLKYFSNKNAPQDAPQHCLDGCPHEKDCPFHAAKIYYKITPHTLPLMITNMRLITKKARPTLKLFKETLKTLPYGRCVFRCDNDVMEQQTVNLNLEKGVTATLNMTAFSKKCYRKFHIYGTKGEMFGNDIDGYFTLNIFGKATRKIRTNAKLLSIHASSDKSLISDFVNIMTGKEEKGGVTYIDATLESHIQAYYAEKARKSGKVEEIKRDSFN